MNQSRLNHGPVVRCGHDLPAAFFGTSGHPSPQSSSVHALPLPLPHANPVALDKLTKILRTNLVLAVVFLACALMNARAVDIIGFNIASPKNSNQNFLYPADYAGAPGARTNNWNNLLAGSDGSAAEISLSDGSVNDSAGNIVNGMSVTFHPATSGGGIYNRTSGGTNDGKMFADVSDTYGCSGYSQYGFIDITNIPYANYDIYCYFRPDNGSGSSNTRGGFWLITNTPSGSLRCYIRNQSNDVAQTQEPVPSNSGANYVQSTTTSIPSGGAPWSSIQGGNYAVFSNLTNSWTRIWFAGLGNGSAAVDDQGNYVTGGNAAVRFKVCGFQIVEVPTGVPTRLYLQSSNLTLHAGNPAGTQVAVLADLDTGVTGVNVTTSPGITFASDNTNVATVSASGLLTAGTNGTANLIVTYQGLSLTNPVPVIGPTSLSISVARTNLLVGNGHGDTTTATLLATFSDATNVAVNSYGYVSFAGTVGIVTASTNGTLAAVGAGTFSVSGTYDGVSITTNNAGLVSTFVAPGNIAAFSVNVTDLGDPMSFHDLSGAPGARLAYWNNMVMSFGNVTNEIDNPADYQGNALNGTIVQLLPNNPSNQGLLTAGTRTTNESVMFNTMFDQGANNGTSPLSYIVVSNVPYATYDAYFYFYNDTAAPDRPGQVTIDGVTQYRINSASYPTVPDNSGNGYVQAVQPSSISSSITSVPFGNYIKFSGLTDTTLNVSWGAVGQDVFGDANNVTRLRLAGFQIVKSLVGLNATNIYLQSPVPGLLPGNPGTYSLSVLADFDDGTKAGNITTLSGIGYASSDSNIFTVDANGVITPGNSVGSATLTVTYQSQTLTQMVSTVAPTSVTISSKPDTLYLDGVNGAGTAQARVFANFPGYTNVEITTFGTLSFNDLTPSVATDSGGVITPVAYGTADLGVTYLGSSYTTTGALTVGSIANAPVLKNRYSFRDSSGSATVTDSVGGANGTVVAPLTGGLPIVLDGERANFPANGDYSVAPYIKLPAGLISSRGDVTIDMWVGVSTLNTWERFFDIGSSGKGTDAHNSGNGITSLFCTPFPGDSANPRFNLTDSLGTTEVLGAAPLPLGTEEHLTLVYAYNQNVVKMYVNGVLANTATPVSGATLQTLDDQDVWLGASLWNDPPFNGWIDEFRIYEGGFSDAQVASSDAAGPNVGLISTTPVTLVESVSSGNLNLSWPADHLGWRLQVQTNSLSAGLGANWVTVPNSTNMDSLSIPMTATNGAVFYRLVYP